MDDDSGPVSLPRGTQIERYVMEPSHDCLGVDVYKNPLCSSSLVLRLFAFILETYFDSLAC